MEKKVVKLDADQFNLPAPAPRIKDIDKDVVWKLAALMCSSKEIGDILGIAESTVNRNFGVLIEKARSVGKRSLRRAQMAKALEGDSRMLIFLGKQYLSQKDTVTETETTQPLPWKDD
jgi:hypothetical protein